MPSMTFDVAARATPRRPTSRRSRRARERTTHARLGALAGLALLWASPSGGARAAEFERLDVTEDSGVYRIEASLLLDVPHEAVLQALMDFEGQRSIAPPIREIRVMGSRPDGTTVVEMVTEICIGGFFCADVKQLQLVRFVPPGLVSATAIRDEGDVRAGRVDVEVTGENGRARVQIACAVQPARRRPFFIPKSWVLNALRRQARQSAAGLEALASRIAERPAPDGVE